MKKNKNNDELNLIEIYFFVFKNKWKILIITTIAALLGYAFTLAPMYKTPMYKVETEVRGISIPDEFMYQTYNSYINKKTKIFTTEGNEQAISIHNEFERIDGETLLNLFFDKLYDPQSLAQILKKSGYINEENYQNSEDYENAIKKLSSSIKLKAPEDNDIREQPVFFIETITSDLKKWQNLLIFIDKYVNKEIQKDIKVKFNIKLNSEQIIKQYQIADIEDEIRKITNIINNNKDNINFVNELRNLESQKKLLIVNLIANKDIERMKNLFNTTPIMSQNEFFAAKIMYLNTEFDNINSADKLAIILVFGFAGFVISFFYIHIAKSFKNRK